MVQALLDEHGSVNMYLINDHFIIPWTLRSSCSIALLLNPTGRAPNAMASHVTACVWAWVHLAFVQAWAEDNEEFEDALARFQEHHSLSDDFSLWICTFGQYVCYCRTRM